MTSPRRSGPPVVVVGGGVSGLAAAWRIAVERPDRQVVVLEQRPRTGGVLRRERLPAGPGVPGGMRVDTGAESMLARRPEAVDLAVELGLADDLVAPRTSRAGVVSRGAVHPMPPRTLMGVPSDPAALAGLLTDDEVRRAAAEVAGTPVDGDVSVGDWVGARLGPAVVDRLVEPLLGGVYAGRAERLSLRACLPALWPAARDGSGLLAAAAASVAASASGGTAAGATGSAAPVFAGLVGGVARLGETLHARLEAAGVLVRVGACVTGVRRADAGWVVDLGPADQGGRPVRSTLAAAAVVLAVPAAATARLLEPLAPDASARLRSVPSASVAVVTAAVAAADLADVDLSGLLVPPVEGRLVKAATLSSSKWAWVAEVAPDVAVVRLSVGRAGEPSSLHRTDDELTRVAVQDLGEVLERPLDVRSHLVTRWGGGLPQYEPGHLELVEAVLSQVDGLDGLAVAGSVYRGVGIPACVQVADAAARRVLGFVR